MVNSKKNTKSIIALVVLSLLLIASICLAATGAWFTDKVGDETGSVNFGKINIDYTTPYKFTQDGTTVMPGDTLHFEGVVTNQEDEAWVAVQISLTGVKTPVNIDKVVKLAKNGTINLSTELGDIELKGEDYDNMYQGKQVAVTVKVCAVQAKNVTDITETSKYADVWAYVNANAEVQGPQA